MGFQPSEKKRSQDKDNRGKRPEIQGEFPVLPEPDIMDKGVAISLGNIVCRVKLYPGSILLRHHRYRPENWSKPEPELEQNTHELAEVPQKDNKG